MSETQNKSETKVWPLLNNFLQVAFNKTDISTCIKLCSLAKKRFLWAGNSLQFTKDAGWNTDTCAKEKNLRGNYKIKHMNVKRKKSYALTSIQNFAIFLPLSPCDLITEKYPTSLLKIWSCLSLFFFLGFPRALAWISCPQSPSLTCLILMPSVRKFNRSY